ncbi:hypothetical protein [Cellulomonas alba]|uniref:Uncharacterized protein n=1 Tax=Cellulomonas alba TaxID=3053467 RepID=A0ABT7SEN0_9CELL|nr:hypothetical protein [Cellulomonas alba]MDM7854648.1 hypothetical protein [Cellulomonas alba]
MDELTVDRDEIVTAARRLSEAAATPWHSVGTCAPGSPVVSAIQRLSEAWTRGHTVLVADAMTARDTLLSAMRAFDDADSATAERLRPVEHAATERA